MMLQKIRGVAGYGKFITFIDYEPRGSGFNSCQLHHNKTVVEQQLRDQKSLGYFSLCVRFKSLCPNGVRLALACERWVWNVLAQQSYEKLRTPDPKSPQKFESTRPDLSIDIREARAASGKRFCCP